MKVKIGGYPNRWISTHSIESAWVEWRHGVDVLDNPKGIDYVVIKLCDITQSVLNATINKFMQRRERKVKVRIDPEDTWSMDRTLAYIILPMLKQIRESKHSYPFVDPKDTPLIPFKKSKKVADEHGAERWDYVLNEMIWSFEQILDDDEGEAYYRVPYKDDEEVKRASFVRPSSNEVIYLETEEDARSRGRYDKALHDEYNKRLERGLIFFGKYYRSLWD